MLLLVLLKSFLIFPKSSFVFSTAFFHLYRTKIFITFNRNQIYCLFILSSKPVFIQVLFISQSPCCFNIRSVRPTNQEASSNSVLVKVRLSARETRGPLRSLFRVPTLLGPLVPRVLEESILHLIFHVYFRFFLFRLVPNFRKK